MGREVDAMRELVTRSTIEPVPGPVLQAQRSGQVQGLTRRTLLRRAVGLGIGLWAVETLAGTVAFAWSAVAGAMPTVRVGTFADLLAANPGLPLREGFPAYVAAARAFVVLLDPSLGGWQPGTDTTGDGTALNVRALSQRCPHLGCRPNPCVEDFWFHCPCHQSRYDRRGIKVAGERYGPAQRGMDRFAVAVDADGVLTVTTSKVTLGPLPVALGAPGVIPPLVENGCS
jgi:cytochrome b6-f complex iron-sulfur subunit